MAEHSWPTEQPYSTPPFNPQDTFSAVLRNPHFVQFACLLGEPYTSWQWRAKHPEIPVISIVDRLAKLVFGSFDRPQRDMFLSQFSDLLSRLVMADDQLHYSQEDVDWLVRVLDSSDAKLVLAMLFAVASSRETYYTPAELAELTQEGESTWRWRAAQGKIPGAILRGKQWLIPQSGVRAIGIELPRKEIPE